MRCEVEFVVDDIKYIVWNPSSFENLTIPTTKKKVITALAKAHLSRASDDTFDDIVEGKGQGLIALLQYDVQCFVLCHVLIFFQRPPWCWQDLDCRGVVRVS